MKQIAYIGAWGADLQGVNNPQAGDGGVKVYAAEGDGDWARIGAVTPNVNAGGMCVVDGYLYATDERKDLGGVHGNGGGVCAYRIDRSTGGLTFINEVSSAGAYPCSVIADSKRRYAFAANHGNHSEVVTRSVKSADGTYTAKRFFDEGSIAMFPIQADGALGECVCLEALEGGSVLPFFQDTPHPHSVWLDPTEKFLLSGDKGGDRIRAWRVDYEGGKLERVWEQKTDDGSGPRHIAFLPTLSVLYCNSEQDNTVHAYGFDFNTGSMKHLGGATTVPGDYTPGTVGDMFDNNQTADIRIHKSGKYLYVSNRGHNSIACYVLDGEGLPRLAEIVPSGGEIPRAMNFDATGDTLYVVNQRSGAVVPFAVDEATGGLTRKAGVISVPNAVNIQFTEV
jgi:6-phosphogluconolactonase